MSRGEGSRRDGYLVFVSLVNVLLKPKGHFLIPSNPVPTLTSTSLVTAVPVTFALVKDPKNRLGTHLQSR